MDLSAAILPLYRAAILQLVQGAGPGAVLRCYTNAKPAPGADAGMAPALVIPLAFPVGTADGAGISLATTDYGLVIDSGDIQWARLLDAAGVWCADFSAGLAGDDPGPDLILPFRTFRAGAFARLHGARINVG